MTSAQRREIIEALQNRQKIEAIKLYREATGRDLMEAKDFIESLQQSLTTGEVPDADRQLSLSDELRNEIVEQLQAGKKIHAVKVYRDATSTSLRQAKDAVEAIGRENGVESGSSGFGCVAVVLALLVAGSVFATS